MPCLRERRRQRFALPAGREHNDWLGRKPAKREGKRTGRRLVQPLRVVDEERDRAAVCKPAEKVEDDHREGEPVDVRGGKRGRNAEPTAAHDGKAPSTAAEALDRINLPPEAVERISELLTPGSSLVVSDHGLGRETGRYTEFIVLTQ